jgi:hypothetical protein
VFQIFERSVMSQNMYYVVSSFVQDDGRLLLGLYYFTINRAGWQENINHGAQHSSYQHHHMTNNNIRNNAVEEIS